MRFFTLCFLFATAVAFSQEKIKHIVASGETIYNIAKKYDIKESEIFDLNPKIKGSAIQLNSVLWIPSKNEKPKENLKPNEKILPTETANLTITHQVLAKETLYGISKKYKTTVDKIKEANPSMAESGLQEGTKITIPVSKEVSASQPKAPVNTTTPAILPKVQKPEETVSQNTDEAITHNVVAKETKYGISKRYNISIAELEKLNPNIVKGLSTGDLLIIREGKMKKSEVAVIPQNNNKDKGIISQNTTAKTPSLSADTKSKADFLIAKATETLGTPYLYGGTDCDGFDCSGLVFTCFKHIDVTLPRISFEMAANAGVKIDITQAQKGDLIFFDTLNRGGVSHVGIVTETSDDEIKFIHASTSSGVMISSTKEEYFAQRLLQVNRVLEN